MADVVQFRMEQMLDEFEDLERKGIFSHQEIAEIAKKRRNFEYRLKRPSPLKHDYLAYIDYEKRLDAFRRLRRKAVSRDLVENGKKKLRRSVSDDAGVRRILRIFDLATTRFKGDLSLWFQYLEFCREHGHGRMKKVLAKVIRFHPKRPQVWIYAAAWQFDHNLNVLAARNLMHRGLRACPGSEDLWVEYLRMELTYLNKLKTRKAVLGEDTGLQNEQKKWKDENKDLFMPLDEERMNSDLSKVQDEEPENKLDIFREHASSIIRATYSGAVEALPSNLNLRKRFLEILDDLDTEDANNLRAEILGGIKEDFANDPDYWDWLARLQIFDQKKEKRKQDLCPQLDKAVGIYEESLKILPSAKMFLLYAKFWMDFISLQGDDSQVSEFAPTAANDVHIQELLQVYAKADSMGCMTEDLASQYISLYLRLGRLEDARTMAQKLSKGKLSRAVKLWELRISIELKWITNKSSSDMDDLRSTFKLVSDILEKVEISEAGNLWHMAIKFFVNHKEYFDMLIQTFMALVPRYSEGGFSVSSAFVNLILQRDGIQRAREVYKRFFALPHPSLALHRNCIEFESNLALIGDKDGIAHVRKVYESALTNYSQDVGLWQDYYSLEKKVGTAETAHGVYWRARKAGIALG